MRWIGSAWRHPRATLFQQSVRCQHDSAQQGRHVSMRIAQMHAKHVEIHLPLSTSVDVQSLVN